MNAPMMVVDSTGRASVARDLGAGRADEEHERVLPHVSLMAVVAFLVWSALVAAAGAFAAIHVAQGRLQEALVMRPPVVVLDSMDWIQHAGTGDTPARRYANGAARLKATVDGLRKHGAIVFDASAAYSYPDAVRLDAPKPGEPLR